MAQDPSEGSPVGFSELAGAYWKSKGSRLTYVRRLICSEIADQTLAFTPEYLLGEIRKKDPQVALSSLYRTLTQLVQAGLLVVTTDSEGVRHFNIAGSNRSSSSHVVCQDCGKVIPIENPCLSLRETDAATRQGFRPRKITLQYEATCDSFQKSGECPNRNPAGKKI